MAVIKSKNAKKNSIITFILLFFTKFLIPDPKAAQGEIEIGQIIRAIQEINNIDIIKLPSFGKKPEAAILDMVQALGLINWNNAASWNFKGLDPSSLILLKDPKIL